MGEEYFLLRNFIYSLNILVSIMMYLIINLSFALFACSHLSMVISSFLFCDKREISFHETQIES